MDVLSLERGASGDLLFHRLWEDRNTATCCAPLEGWDELEQSQEIKLAARSRPYVTRQESWEVWALVRERERVSVRIP